MQTDAGMVMVVEDDEDIRISLKELLEDDGYNTLLAANGREALDYLEQGTKPCLIFLDLMMPVMDGWQFRREQQKNESLKKIPVAVITAAGESAAASVQAQKVILKPLDIDEVLAVVRKYCSDPPAGLTERNR
jgi:CheY-like chemotaxis protein